MTLRGSHSNGSVRTWRRHFPISSVDHLLDLMREVLSTSGYQALNNCASFDTPTAQYSFLRSRLKTETTFDGSASRPYTAEPDLAFISIVLGFIENHLTLPSPGSPDSDAKSKSTSLHHTKITRSRNSSTTSSIGSKVLPSPLSLYSTESSDIPPLSDQIQQTTCFSFEPGSVTTNASHAGEIGCKLGGKTEVTCSATTRSSRLRPRHPRNYVKINSSGLNDSNISDSWENECHVRNNSANRKRRRFSDTCIPKIFFPCLTFDETERLYQDFYSLIMCSQKLQPFIRVSSSRTSDSGGPSNPPTYATRPLIRAVCEVLWSRMTSRKYKEKLIHTQSVYSFLTSGILDSFGLAYTTVAACQLLGYSDVDLTLSEDHGWVEFGPADSRETADVASWVHNMHLTPHDQSECRLDKIDSSDANALNPPPIRMPPLTNSWLYVNGCPVLCHPRILAVVAAVTALQPGASLVSASATLQAPISAPPPDVASQSSSCADLVAPSELARHLSSSPTISMQLVSMKHRLLWLFYDAGCLARYPLGLTNLADLEDAFPSRDNLPHPTNDHSLPRPPVISLKPSIALDLYLESVHVTQTCYSNQHAYPYTCLAGFLYRHGDDRGALHYWSKAAQVMGQYNHSSEDWEIYRELLEIATQSMPQLFRNAAEASRSCSEGSVKADPDGCLFQPDNVLDDPQCLANLISFYDHLCLWEEGSPVPVLHIGWVDKLMVNLSRFSARARRLLRISVHESKDAEPPADALKFDNQPPQSPASSSCSTSLSRRSSTRCTRLPKQRSTCVTQPLKVQTASPLLTSFADSPASSPVVTTTISAPETVPNATQRSTADLTRPSPALTCISCMPTPQFCSYMTEKPQQTLSDKAEMASALSSLYEEARPKLEPELEDPDASPSPPPLGDFSTNEEFLTNLVEACDRRLLNPAFLWGIEPNTPFLPPDVSPEDVLARLLANLEDPDVLTIDQPLTTSLFPTPPNSGSLCDGEDKRSGESKTSDPTPVNPSAVDSIDTGLANLNDTKTCVPSGEPPSKSPSTIPASMESLYVDLVLYSTKMISIVDLLRASRLNASAIKLALTAQSQVSLRRSCFNPIFNG